MQTPMLFLLGFLLFYQCTTSKRALTDLDKIGLKGQVKYLKFTSESFEGNNQQNNAQTEEEVGIDNEFFVDEDGMISEQRQYTAAKLSLLFVFKYDEKNLLISKEYFNSSKDLVMRSRFENVLDKHGRLVKQMEFRASENFITGSDTLSYQKLPYETVEFLYDQKGSLKKLTYIQSVFGPSFPKTVIEYKNGVVYSESLVDTFEDTSSSTTNECLELDDAGNCTKLKVMGQKDIAEYINAEIRYYE